MLLVHDQSDSGSLLRFRRRKVPIFKQGYVSIIKLKKYSFETLRYLHLGTCMSVPNRVQKETNPLHRTNGPAKNIEGSSLFSVFIGVDYIEKNSFCMPCHGLVRPCVVSSRKDR